MKTKSIFSIIIAVGTILVTLYIAYTEFVQYRERRLLIERQMIEIAQGRIDIELLQKQLDSEMKKLLNNKLAEIPKSVELASLDQKFKNIDDKIAEVKEQTIGLRQAINPLKPEEILTIARLTDDVKTIRKDLEGLESNISAKQKEFKDSILRELKSSGESTILILVVLIPLVLNFLYTVWKDYKSDKNEKVKS